MLYQLGFEQQGRYYKTSYTQLIALYETKLIMHMYGYLLACNVEATKIFIPFPKFGTGLIGIGNSYFPPTISPNFLFWYTHLMLHVGAFNFINKAAVVSHTGGTSVHIQVK